MSNLPACLIRLGPLLSLLAPKGSDRRDDPRKRHVHFAEMGPLVHRRRPAVTEFRAAA